MKTNLLTASLALALFGMVVFSFKPPEKPAITESCSLSVYQETVKNYGFVITEKMGETLHTLIPVKDSNLEILFQQHINQRIEDGWTLHTISNDASSSSSRYAVFVR